MKRKRHPLRALPLGIQMSDFLWEPDAEEKRVAVEAQRRQSRLAKLHRLEKLWAAQDFERLKRRAAELAAIVEQDRAFVAREQAFEREMQRRQAIIMQLHDEDAKLERKLLLARLEKATKELNKDVVRSERAALLAKGVVRGRRG